MEWFDILDGRLLYEPALLSRRDADNLLDWLRLNVRWRQESPRGRPFPRLNAWYADPGLRWSYSGVSHLGTGWVPEMETLKRRVEASSGADFNSLLLNRYRNGSDSIGYHADAEPELGINPMVATLSLGSERKLVLKHSVTRERITHVLSHGSLFVMGGSTQHHWMHALPKTEAEVGERISLTFRRIIKGSKP